MSEYVGEAKSDAIYESQARLAEELAAVKKLFEEKTAQLTRLNEELSEREAALRHQATILANINDAVIATDPNRLITYLNPAAVRQYGWQLEEALGLNPVHLFRAEFIDTTDLDFAEQLETTGGWHGEVIVHRKDGSTFYAEAHAITLIDENGKLLGHIGVQRDITKRKRAETELLATQEALRGYSHHLVETIENEQRNLARELHDQAGQSLSALKLTLGQLRRELNSGRHYSELLETMEQIIDTVLEDLHRLAFNLRPVSLDRYGLVMALQQYIELYRKQNGIDVDFIHVGIEEQRPPADQETTIYRVIQEALTNISRHARAQHVHVTLERRQDCTVAVVEDDGQGFDLEVALHSNRLGILGMRERVEMLHGNLKIETAPGKGSVIYIELPYPLPDTSS